MQLALEINLALWGMMLCAACKQSSGLGSTSPKAIQRI